MLKVLLVAASIMGAIIYVLAMIPALGEGVFSAALIYSFFYAGLLGVTLTRQLSYSFRVYGWLLFLFVLGVQNLINSGFNIDAGLFLLAFVMMAVLFLDFRKASIALVLSLISISLMGFITVLKNHEMRIGLSQRDPILWMVGGLIFLFVGFTTAFSLSVLLHGLTENLRKLQISSLMLEERNKELLESELYYRSLVETSPSAIVRFDLQGIIESINLAGEKLVGYQKMDILGKNMDVFLDVKGEKQTENIIKQVLEKGTVSDAKVRMMHKNGTPIWVEFSAAQILNAEENIVGVISIGKDNTEKRKAEEILQVQAEELRISQQKLRTLTQKMISVQEHERRVIARELHDDAGQALVTLKHGVSILLEELGDEKGKLLLRERLERNLDLVIQAMGYVRSASHRLRPPALEIGGIDVSLEELCRRTSLDTHLQISYKGISLLDVPDNLVISLYRFVQEALTNTLKHANARYVDVRLKYDDGKIMLSVEDDGYGVEKEQEEQSGIGLLGLQERFALYSGEISVDNRNEQGYLITATVPWKKGVLF
ncbi:MAG: PAS domain S-box protein [Anaerolineae bacterium]|jgi:PAS domain S-box-containing protein|nr:PAS domain S-box protein [Anaerolineae bacterium]